MGDSTTLDARELANFILDLAKEQGIGLSITSLLKIVYFAHGWHLAMFSEPLVGQPFEAWQHGPVVRVLYDCFKSESGDQIRTRARKLNPKTARFEVCEYSLQEPRKAFLKSILISYSRFHPYKLSEMTHEEGSPWHKVWTKSETESAPGMRIPNDHIRSYFLSLNEADIYRA